MSDNKPVLPPAEPAATAVTENVAAKAPAAAKALPEQNPAFKAMGMFVPNRRNRDSIIVCVLRD
jgi:hypothetical protein